MEDRKLKVVVFGAHGAGKSTFINALDSRSRHIDTNGDDGLITIALDFGRVRMHGHMVYLFGTPGQDRFEFAREILANGMNAAVIIVDARNGADPMTRKIHRWLVDTGVPLMILANKCDCADASAQQVREQLGDDRVIPVSALKGTNIHEAMEEFIARCVTPSRIT